MRRVLVGVSALAVALVVQVVATREIPPQAAEVLQHLSDSNQAQSLFGYSVAADANTLVVGSPWLDSKRGGAFVYVRGAGDLWEYVTTLTASDRALDDNFGIAVDVDGDTIVVGAYVDDGVVVNQGSAYVFTRTDGTWSQTAHLLPIVQQNGAGFGGAVSVEGTTILVGAYNETVTVGGTPHTNQGAAYVYTLDEDTWALAAILRDPSGRAYDHFGTAVAVVDGVWIVGAPDADIDSLANCGQVYLFSPGARPQPAMVITGGQPNAKLGSSIGAGASLGVYWPVAIGAPGYEPTAGCTNCGGAYVFDLNDPVATPVIVSSAAPGADALFGTSVSLWGHNLVVGSPGAHYSDGIAEWLAYDGTAWQPVGVLETTAVFMGGQLGRSVAVSGSSVLAGGPFNPYLAQTNRGSVINFGLGPDVNAITPEHGPLTGGTLVTISGANFDADATATLGGVPLTKSGPTLPYQFVGLTPPQQAPGWTALQIQNVNGRQVVVQNAFQYYWRVDEIEPAVGPPGITCTITGAGLPCTDNSVYFGTSLAQIQNCSSTSVTVTVPVFTSPRAAGGADAAAIPVDVFVNGPDDGQVVVENGFTYASGDLLLSALVAAAATGPGSTLRVTEKTKNLGPDDLPASTTRFYLSTDATLDGGDLLLGERAVPALAPRVLNVGTIDLPIGAGQAAGAYWLIAKADAPGLISERSETNNVKTRPVKIDADLQVSVLRAPARVTRGVAFNVTESTKNAGPGGALASTTRLVLSADAVYDAGDTVLYDRAVGALAKGAQSRVVTPVTLAADLPVGTYYLVGVADVLGAVPETKEANNSRAKRFVVQ